MVVVAIGPDARKEESQQVLNETGGENVFYVADYESIAEAMKDITDLICRMYSTTICRYNISALKVQLTCL